MTMQDPIADMLTRIRNAQMRGHKTVAMPHSRQREAIGEVLVREGYVAKSTVEEGTPCKTLTLKLKYHAEKPVIAKVQRVSRPGLRVYRGARDLPWVQGGLGIAVVSTSQGIMTDHDARKRNCGGEVLCTVE